MTVKALFFAHFQDIVGSREITVDVSDHATVQDCAALLHRQYPAFEHLLDYARVAVNTEFAKADTPLSDGDEIAFLPPMSGG